MADQINIIANIILATVCITFSVVFFVVPVPHKAEIKNYSVSLKVLSTAYLAIALFTITILAFNLNDNSNEPLTFICLLISSSQALLFTFTLISLINPRFVTVKQLFFQILPLFLFVLSYFFITSFIRDPYVKNISGLLSVLPNPVAVLRILFAIFYLFQLVYYPFIFIRLRKGYERDIHDFFSDSLHLRMKWISFSFFSALIIGIVSIISGFAPGKNSDTIMTFLYMAFYFYFAIEYVRYPEIFKILQSVFDKTDSPVTVPRYHHSWDILKSQVLEKKYYVRQGITIEEMAHQLQIGRTTLSKYINGEEGLNFNRWINTLRIEEAKTILGNNPEITAIIVSEMVGYSEPANFSNQFKQVTGISLSEWRKENIQQPSDK